MNVFGKDPWDYQLIASQTDGMQDSDILDALRHSDSAINWDHSFDRQNFRTDADANVAAFGLISNNLEALQMEIEEVLRERFQIPEFIPINSSIPEGATSYSFRVINRLGKGKFINKDGSNVEAATASVGKIVFSIEYAGIEPAWTLQELRESLYTGISISSESLEAGIQGALDHIQDVGFEGDADVGFTGLLNSTEIPVFGGTVPDFTTATEDEIVDFVNDTITSLGVSTNEIIYQHFGMSEMYCVLPTTAYDKIATTSFGTDKNKTIAQWLSTNNSWTQRTGKSVVFKSLPRAKDAAVTGTGRAIFYPSNSRILEMAIPIMPRIITTDSSAGYRIKAPMEYSMSGVNIKRSSLMLYADGVLGAP